MLPPMRNHKSALSQGQLIRCALYISWEASGHSHATKRERERERLQGAKRCTDYDLMGAQKTDPVAFASVEAQEARDLLRSGHRYVDVRMAEDFQKGHVEGALNIPYYSSVTAEGRVKNPQFLAQVSGVMGKDDHFIVGCGSGARSQRAAADLVNEGFKNVKNMKGGYLAWIMAN